MVTRRTVLKALLLGVATNLPLLARRKPEVEWEPDTTWGDAGDSRWTTRIDLAAGDDVQLVTVAHLQEGEWKTIATLTPEEASAGIWIDLDAEPGEALHFRARSHDASTRRR